MPNSALTNTAFGASDRTHFPGLQPAGVIASAVLGRLGEAELPADDERRVLSVDVLSARIYLAVGTSPHAASLTVTGTTSGAPASQPAAVFTCALRLEANLIERLCAAIEARDDATEPTCNLGRLPARDPIHALASALNSPAPADRAVRQLYAESMALMLAARILSDRSQRAASRRGTGVAPLPKWRLKKVADFVEAHLAEAITLADLARTAGLTPMYFAAQFRAAKQMRLHDYILSRRVERAQNRLADTPDRLVDIALDVGFQTQAHFTTVFKRFAGTTPHRWREIARGRQDAA